MIKERIRELLTYHLLKKVAPDNNVPSMADIIVELAGLVEKELEKKADKNG